MLYKQVWRPTVGTLLTLTNKRVDAKSSLTFLTQKPKQVHFFWTMTGHVIHLLPRVPVYDGEDCHDAQSQSQTSPPEGGTVPHQLDNDSSLPGLLGVNNIGELLHPLAHQAVVQKYIELVN